MTFIAVEVAIAAETAAAITAAEIATAAAAAESAAAVTAAEIAAAEAATAAAAAETTTAAATAAATEAGASAIPEAASILEATPGLVPPPATPLPPAGVEQIASAAPLPSPPPAGVEQIVPAGSTPPPPVGSTPPPVEPTSIQTASGPVTSDISQFQSDQNIVDLIKNFKPGPEQDLLTPEVLQATGNAPTPPDLVGESYAVPRNPALGYAGTEQGIVNSSVLPQTPTAGTNPFLDGLKSVGNYMSENKTQTAVGGYMALQALNSSNQKGYPAPEKKTFKNQYSLSPNFQGGPYSEPNVYKPITYQEGGITQASRQNNDAESGVNGDDGDVPRYYRGELTTSRGQKGDVYGATQRFLDMYDPASRYAPPEGASNPNVGIFRDTNPSTANKSALEAADIRRKAIENRAYVKTGANYMPPSRDMGQLDFTIIGSKDKRNKGSDSDPVLAASGGIMQANLGGYAAGGNPRLLRGPGDGMSDNIPAMIGNKQPARLADGEFVVPADVVSHLGNGSTEAGAKRLHEMMNQVRMDRTGKKKQAPAVKAKKYIPK